MRVPAPLGLVGTVLLIALLTRPRGALAPARVASAAWPRNAYPVLLVFTSATGAQVYCTSGLITAFLARAS